MDVSAMIDYTLNYTDEPRLTYIGHSLGGTTVYTLLSTLPEYNDKMKLVMTWSGPSFWKDKNLLRIVTAHFLPYIQVSKVNFNKIINCVNVKIGLAFMYHIIVICCIFFIIDVFRTNWYV